MTDPTDVTNHLDANGNIVSGVPDFGAASPEQIKFRITRSVEGVGGQQSWLVIASSEKEAREKYLRDEDSEFEEEQIEVTDLGEPEAAQISEAEYLECLRESRSENAKDATIARLRGVIEAAVKGCKECGGKGLERLQVGTAKFVDVDCPACRELRAALEGK